MANDFEIPVAKRQKLDSIQKIRGEGSRLFAPFRTIGLVSSTDVPFTSVALGKTIFQITTSVGQSLQTYDLRKGLNLVFISRPQCPQKITASCAYRDKVFAAWGNNDSSRGVWIFKRGQLVAELDTSDTTEQQIDVIVIFGAWIVGCGSSAIEVWRNDSYEHYTTIIPLRTSSNVGDGVFSRTLCTLPTFLNKVFVGKEDGAVEVYNVSTGKLVHSIKPELSTSGKVTALSASTALSLLAIAYADGTINIVNVEDDETIIALRHSSSTHPVTSITFRGDGAGAGDDGRSDGVMATSSEGSGNITLWDLNKGGKVVGVLSGAHETRNGQPSSGINKIEFLAGQPVLISSGRDNSLKSWIFDQTPFSPVPRPLHVRSGHAAPVTALRFLPAASDGSEAAGKWLLSAGQDRSLWGFSLRKDGQSSELSQGNIKTKAKKLGKIGSDQSSIEDIKVAPVISIACSLNRDGGMGAIGGSIWTNPKSTNAEEAGMTGWESVVTAHDGDSIARTWFWGRKRAGRWAFESGDRRPVTSVGITSCGTFAIIGSAGGALDMFNLQSGMHRQRFPPKLKPADSKRMELNRLQRDKVLPVYRGHVDCITGIVVDSLNQTMISAALDGAIIFWDFATGNIRQKIIFDGSSPTAIRYNSVSNLVAISCDDLCIRVIDIDTRKTVRELWGCVGQIYDHCFSHDGRWIVAASMDSVIRIFDLATGHLIDAFKTETCTNVAFSPTGEFLATAHAGSIGINIWNNKSLYTTLASRQIDEEKDGIIDLTQSLTFNATSQLVMQDEILGSVDDIDDAPVQNSIDQLDKALLTLSLVPQSRWQTLLNLDIVRERNKPIAPPEKPKAAPFFLGSTNIRESNHLMPLNNAGNDSSFNGGEAIPQEEKSRIARLTSQSTTSHETQLTTLLHDLAPQNLVSSDQEQSGATAVSSHLTSLSPSQADLAIRTLTLHEMPLFIRALTIRLQQRRDFELVNTWMAVFLRCHAEFAQVDNVRHALEEFKGVMDSESKRLAELVGWVRGVGEFLRSSR